MNQNAGTEQTISPEMQDLLSIALFYCEVSHGAFDISVAPLIDLWDFKSDSPAVPDKADIETILPNVDYRSITLNENRLYFPEGMSLDLGGIAKGYIADKLKEYIESKGITSALINLGGNILTIGSRPDGSAWNIGIQKPFSEGSEVIETLQINNLSMVTSGIYERYFEIGGKIYHHILDPESGFPADNSLLSVTILSQSSAVGDALSTACFVMGPEMGMDFVESLSDVEAVFVLEDYSLLFSSGIHK